MPQKINSLAKTSEVNTQNRSCLRVRRASQFWRKIKELSCIWLLMKEKRAILPCYHQLIRHYSQACMRCNICHGNQMYYSNVKQNKSKATLTGENAICPHKGAELTLSVKRKLGKMLHQLSQTALPWNSDCNSASKENTLFQIWFTCEVMTFASKDKGNEKQLIVQ